MSPILDLQRRHSTTFRLRIGEKVPTSNGKTKPVRLTDAIRVTSANPSIVDAFVAMYGGERRSWEGQWEAKLPITKLPITLLPGQSITQWWEFWAGATCARRCDGFTQTTDEPCVCPNDLGTRMADKQACSPTTRLSVICPEVDVLGAGMMVTHGRIAAETLPSSVAVAEAALAHGVYVPATLVIEEMVGPGKRFVVPRIDITGMSLHQLQSGQIDAPAIGRAEVPALPVPPATQVEPPEGDGGGGSPSSPDHLPVNPELVRAALDQLPDDLRAEVGKAWKEAMIWPLNSPEFDAAEQERALSLIAPYLERHHWTEKIVGLLEDAYGDDQQAATAAVQAIGGVTGTEDEHDRMKSYIGRTDV